MQDHRAVAQTGDARLRRRGMLQLAGAAALSAAITSCTEPGGASMQSSPQRVVYTFGDSILDCGHYNPYGVTPGGLLVHNEDALFPEFRGRDLSAQGLARLEHRARDGATVAGLPAQ